MDLSASGERDVGRDADRAGLARRLTVLRLGRDLLTALLTDAGADAGGRREAGPDPRPWAGDIVAAMRRAADEIAGAWAVRSR